jgi:hypothetical protein
MGEPASRQASEGVVELPLPARIGSPIGEVEVAKERLGEGKVELCLTIFHHYCVSLHIAGLF